MVRHVQRVPSMPSAESATPYMPALEKEMYTVPEMRKMGMMHDL